MAAQVPAIVDKLWLNKAYLQEILSLGTLGNIFHHLVVWKWGGEGRTGGFPHISRTMWWKTNPSIPGDSEWKKLSLGTCGIFFNCFVLWRGSEWGEALKNKSPEADSGKRF